MRIDTGQGLVIEEEPDADFATAAGEPCPASCLCSGRLTRADCDRRLDRLHRAVVATAPLGGLRTAGGRRTAGGSSVRAGRATAAGRDPDRRS